MRKTAQHVKNLKGVRDVNMKSWTNLIFGDSGNAYFAGKGTNFIMTSAGKFLEKSLLFGAGMGLNAIDVILTIDATLYQPPREYSAGNINTNIEQSRLN